MSSPSKVASASCCSRRLRSMEYSSSSGSLSFCRYAMQSTSSASAYSARFGDASGENSSSGTASKNFINGILLRKESFRSFFV